MWSFAPRPPANTSIFTTPPRGQPVAGGAVGAGAPGLCKGAVRPQPARPDAVRRRARPSCSTCAGCSITSGARCGKWSARVGGTPSPAVQPQPLPARPAHPGQEGRRELCCIFVDVNGLHELNNTQGHQTGDRMLQEVARQIRQDSAPGGPIGWAATSSSSLRWTGTGRRSSAAPDRHPGAGAQRLLHLRRRGLDARPRPGPCAAAPDRRTAYVRGQTLLLQNAAFDRLGTVERRTQPFCSCAAAAFVLFCALTKRRRVPGPFARGRPENRETWCKACAGPPP